MSCRRARVLFVFFIFCGWWCPVGGLMSYLCFLFIVVSSRGGSCLICVFYLLWMVVSCRRAHVLFVFFIYCGKCPVGGLMSYLCFLLIVDGGFL